MSPASDHAELSTLRSQLHDLNERVTRVAERFGTTPDSAIAFDLYATERSLAAARRSLDKAISALE